MKITVSVKQLGKRKPSIEKQSLEVSNLSSPCSLEDILKAVVAQQVETFNERTTQPKIVSFLVSEDIQEALEHGKVSFGDTYNKQKANQEEAQDNALLAFKDGLFKVFLNEQEVETLSQEITFTSQDIFTFIRLTFLSGN